MTTPDRLGKDRSKTLEPIDPDTPAGKAASAALGELFADIADRLRREGKAVPECLQ